MDVAEGLVVADELPGRPYKGAPPSYPGRAAVEPPPAPLLAAAASSRLGRLCTKPNPSPPSLASTKTHRRAATPAEPPTASYRPLQRRPPPATAAHPTAGHLYSQIQTKPVPSHPSTLPPPFPGQARRRLTGILPPRAGQPHPGPHCKTKQFSEGLRAKG
jgi:hypothetical protein